MIGPSYGKWWEEHPAKARARLGLVILPVVVLSLWFLYLYTAGAYLGRALFDAVERGDLAEIHALLERGAPISARNGDGATLLHWSLVHGRSDLVALFIDLGADVSTVDRYGVAPIHLAASNGDAATVALLIERGAVANVVSDRYGAPLHWAAHAGQLEVARRLLDAGAAVDPGDQWGRTPLHYAVLLGHLEMAKLLASRGADPDARDSNGRTLLHWAATSHRPDIATFLIALGASVDARDDRGNTALHHAAQRGDLEVASILVGHGADVNAATPGIAVTPLHLAARRDEDHVARLLLAAGANVNAFSELYGTPLHWAAGGGHRATVVALLEYGASTRALDGHRLTASDRATETGHPELLALLGGARADAGRPPAEPLLASRADAPGDGCVFPRRMNQASRIFLDNYLEGEMSMAEFRRQFSLPNSEYLDLGKCVVDLHE